MHPLIQVVEYALLPMVAATIGAIVAVFRPPSATMRSYIQHFAAGIVFSVVSVELLPEIVQIHLPWEIAVGFSAGVALMLAIKKFTNMLEDTRPNSSLGFFAGIGVDIFIDGLLIGIGFTAGTKTGILLTIALTVELLSLGLAVASSLTKSGTSRAKSIATVCGLSSLIVVAAVLGATVFRDLSPGITEIVLAFGLAALLYLVIEELLVKAHEEPETPLATASFFVGFLFFLITGMIG